MYVAALVALSSPALLDATFDLRFILTFAFFWRVALLTAAFTTYGWWGGQILDGLLLPAYQERLKQEKKDGGASWLAHRWKIDTLERMSIRIARSNYQLLAAFTRPRVSA